MYKLVPRPPTFKTGSTPLVVYMPNKKFKFFEFPRRLTVSQSSANSTAIRSVNQILLHAWHVYSVYSFSIHTRIIRFSGNNSSIATNAATAGSTVINRQHKLGSWALTFIRACKNTVCLSMCVPVR